LQTTTLLDAIEEFKFDACIGGARRDEEKPEQERIFRCVMILVNGTKKSAS
jgi:sulfate adenylyltransferase subunit 2